MLSHITFFKRLVSFASLSFILLFACIDVAYHIITKSIKQQFVKKHIPLLISIKIKSSRFVIIEFDTNHRQLGGEVGSTIIIIGLLAALKENDF